MEIYRIVKEKYSDTLFASGRANRWNYKGQKVIYAAASRSLACLENVVHASGETLLEQFMMIVIYVPDEQVTDTVHRNQLPDDWFKRARHPACQTLGGLWYQSGTSSVLKVPSAIVHQEYNYALNVEHDDYHQIQMIDQQPFSFDSRIKENQFDC